LNNIIQDNKACLIYFSGENCGVCKALQPKIKDTFNKNYPLIKQYHLDIEEYKEFAISLNVFSMPTILVFLDGKEFIRKNRNMSVDGLIEDLKRPYRLLFN
jgi:thioredoxin-like negative regulator of GroEL